MCSSLAGAADGDVDVRAMPWWFARSTSVEGLVARRPALASAALKELHAGCAYTCAKSDLAAEQQRAATVTLTPRERGGRSVLKQNATMISHQGSNRQRNVVVA